MNCFAVWYAIAIMDNSGNTDMFRSFESIKAFKTTLSKLDAPFQSRKVVRLNANKKSVIVYMEIAKINLITCDIYAYVCIDGSLDPFLHTRSTSRMLPQIKLSKQGDTLLLFHTEVKFKYSLKNDGSYTVVPKSQKYEYHKFGEIKIP